MEDFYLIEDNIYERLFNEYNKFGKLVIAFDYDNTVYDYHNQGHTYEKVINLLRKCKEEGFELIVFTGSPTSRFEEIAKYLNDNDIPFDRINDNPLFFKSDSRKIFYSILLDDRAGLPTAYRVLQRLMDKIAEMRFESEKK